jgi:polyhydroxyalkanoate synthesis regulator phasin
VLSLWQEGMARTTSAKTDASGLDLLEAQIARLKRRIGEIEAELNRLFGSRLYELFTAANIAHRAGRDLLQEMATRLEEDIADVQAQLDALG